MTSAITGRLFIAELNEAWTEAILSAELSPPSSGFAGDVGRMARCAGWRFFDELGGIAAGWTDPELQRALQSNYSDPERLNTPCSRSGIDSAANIGSAGTADGVFEPGSHGRIDVAISDSISGDEQH